MRFLLGLTFLSLTFHAGATGMLLLRATVPGSYDITLETGSGQLNLRSNIPSHLPQPKVESVRRGNVVYVSIIHP